MITLLRVKLVEILMAPKSNGEIYECEEKRSGGGGGT